MFRDLKKYLLRPDLLTLTIGFLLALALFTLVETLVRSMISPIVAAFFGEPGIDFKSFTINHSEFLYGALISAVLIFVVALFAVWMLVVLHRKAAAPTGEHPRQDSNLGPSD
jgi:large conductance mechanosensitive channel